MELSAQIGTVEHPRGIYSARVDDKGRLKLPADFHRYLTEIGAVKVFVTSFDNRIGRIYPIPVWKEIEIELQQGGANARRGAALNFTANDVGGDAEMDGQGRVPVPAELRRAMGVENAPVHLKFWRRGIQFFGDEVYREEKERAERERVEALQAFEESGLL